MSKFTHIWCYFNCSSWFSESKWKRVVANKSSLLKRSSLMADTPSQCQRRQVHQLKHPGTPTKIIVLNLFTFGVLHTRRVSKMTNMRCDFLSSHQTTSYLDPPLPWVPPPHRLNMAPQPCTEVAAMTKVRANTRCLILTSPSCSRHW